jgi:hypothetical protein
MFVYYSTLESSVSLWDCGEFIAAAHKLQVVHPPGAPFFILLGRLFVLFAGDPSNIGFTVNFYSGVCSALTVMFTFKITVLLMQSIKLDASEKVNQIIGSASGLIAAFALCFSDTFWFSAVEGEVYALSSFFTALVLWAALKWFYSKTESSDKWLIFIAYMIGLAIGAHLLSLLVIPSIAFLYLFKYHQVTRKKVYITFIAGMFCLFFIQNGVIPGIPTIMAKMELLMVNSMGMGFDTGIFLTILLIVGGLGYGIYYSIVNKKYHLNLAFISLAYVILGFSSYAMIPIRSREVLPINMNHPDNPFSLKFYINREQYEERPLLYGQYYNARPIDLKEGAETYRKDSLNYAVSGVKRTYEYDAADKTLFPRMSDNQKQSSPNGYRMWSGRMDLEQQVNELEQRIQRAQNPSERQQLEQQLEEVKSRKPSMSENLRFFWDYQMNHMYWRYFMWNFSGRQNDIQGHIYNRYFDGNWISGIPILDNARLGPQDNMPQSMLHNMARNKYYLLPLIIGIFGLILQFKKDRSKFWVLTILFFFTGILINVFLNQPPFEPRERDYVHVGSFQVFCIWIGIGTAGLFTWLRKKLNENVSMGLAVVVAALVPTIMGAQNWDDHDRSGRYLALDLAKDVLSSCPPNAVYFANADNDTYPLWYVQNVEGYRPDVRIINQNLLPSDWYAAQMYDKIYESEPLPMLTPRELYKAGFNEYFQWTPNASTNNFISLEQFIKTITTSNIQSYGNNKFEIYVNKEQAKNYPGMSEADKNAIVDTIRLTMPAGNGMHKGDIALLDFISANAKQGWKRPVCFSTIAGREGYQGFEPYLQKRGMVYQLMPVRYNENYGTVNAQNTEANFDLLMNQYKFGGIKEKPKYWIDDKSEVFPSELRKMAIQLCFDYLQTAERKQFADSTFNQSEEYKTLSKKVSDILAKIEKELPESAAPMDANMHLNFASAYNFLNRTEDMNRHVKAVMNDCKEILTYCRRFGQNKNAYIEASDKYDNSIRLLNSLKTYAVEKKMNDIVVEIEKILKDNPPNI